MPAQPTNLENYFLQLVNAERAKVDAAPLEFNDALMIAADKHGAAMDATDTVEHVVINESSEAERIEAEGYRWTAWGENVGWDPTEATGATTADVDTVFKGFLEENQPARPHYDNMVDANFRDVGISVVDGYYQGPDYQGPAVFVTMDFGRPEDLPPAPSDVPPPPPDFEPVDLPAEQPFDDMLIA
jgi:uncharacterized protein YkwD